MTACVEPRPPEQLAPVTRRITGVDAARAVALLGMFTAHILPLNTADGGQTAIGLLVDGRASALFVVLAGVGVALGTGGPRRPPDTWSHLAAASGLLVRGVLVALLGLWLVGIDPPVAVILTQYGLLFVVAALSLRLTAGALACAAVLVCGIAPVASHVLRAGLPAGPGEQPGFEALAEVDELLVTLAVTGYYPVLPLSALLLAGMAVGRLDLHRRRTALRLVGGGAALAALATAASALLLGPGGGAAAIGRLELARRHHGTTPTDSWWWLAVDAPHSGTPLDLAGTTGTALAVLGAALLLARLARPLVWVLAAVGSVPLTLYTAHVLAVTVIPGGTDHAGMVLLWNVAGAVVVGVALRLTDRRGPLEWAVSTAGRTTRRACIACDGRGHHSSPAGRLANMPGSSVSR
ncbi:MAG: heparan-alpha-glucosaminide N-acetyltransferase domain-containing protein [Pseudonocardia sp.]